MKQTIFYISIIIISFGCTNANKKFEGHWQTLGNKRIPKNYRGWNLDLRNRDDNSANLVRFQFEPNDTMRLGFDKERKVYSGNISNADCMVEYIKSKDHLLITSSKETDMFPLEFERMNEDSVAAYEKNRR